MSDDPPLTFERADGFMRIGHVASVTADMVVVRAPALTPGDAVRLERRDGGTLLAEVRAVDAAGARCTPLAGVAGVISGAPARSDLARLGTCVGAGLLGRVLDAWGRCAGALSPLVAPLEPPRMAVRERAPIVTALRTGVAAIDAFTPIGYGQRVSLNAGAGVGKTTLLRMIVERADVDARVVALVGERGREAAETSARLQALDCWPQTSVFCATSEAPAIERFTAARAATAQAEWLCRRGKRVLLVVDSLTRVANAWRELALAAGEPPAHRGYPPSTPLALARLAERAGPRRFGSITAVYAVLVDGDDQFEPVTDAVRALLDGHIVLARRLSEAGRFPAIDVLRSLSRAMPDITTPHHCEDAALVRKALADLEEAQDLFAIGAYRPGADAWLDACVSQRATIDALLYGGGADRDALAMLARIAATLRDAAGRLQVVA
jgi:flagellum-specific ATP synthase